MCAACSWGTPGPRASLEVAHEARQLQNPPAVWVALEAGFGQGALDIASPHVLVEITLGVEHLLCNEHLQPSIQDP